MGIGDRRHTSIWSSIIVSRWMGRDALGASGISGMRHRPGPVRFGRPVDSFIRERRRKPDAAQRVPTGFRQIDDGSWLGILRGSAVMGTPAFNLVLVSARWLIGRDALCASGFRRTSPDGNDHRTPGRQGDAMSRAADFGRAQRVPTGSTMTCGLAPCPFRFRQDDGRWLKD